jgi:hypothetical protein
MDHAQDDDDMEANTALVESKGKGGKQQQVSPKPRSSALSLWPPLLPASFEHV